MIFSSKWLTVAQRVVVFNPSFGSWARHVNLDNCQCSPSSCQVTWLTEMYRGPWLGLSPFPVVLSTLKTSWWFQPIPKILVKLDHFPQVWLKIKNVWNHHLEKDRGSTYTTSDAQMVTDLPETNSKSTRKWKAGSWKTTFGALAYFQGLCTC